MSTTINCTKEQLLQWRAELSAYQVVSCALMHEEVTEIIGHLEGEVEDLASLHVKRKGFCNVNARRKLLGCAHSKANDAFGKLANSVYDAGVIHMADRPSQTVDDLVMKIYLLDHEKGRMEKCLAVAKEKKQAGEIEDAQLQLQRMITRHRTILKELEQFQHALIKQLDLALEAV
ncbi:hypothetical protein GWC95_05980 [Sediminibacterium roseum]|uniref:DUF2383 domain-containing protein n=1 Tax=Sediminibacterium roseum TaxID=1978412 RepID=A0ABW9ZW56_9BACT|nr:hypothetical protein [Sediminibacterium roseum]NCI49463.1 hypothetical protein [Sediminibacterium roseum]